MVSYVTLLLKELQKTYLDKTGVEFDVNLRFLADKKKSYSLFKHIKKLLCPFPYPLLGFRNMSRKTIRKRTRTRIRKRRRKGGRTSIRKGS